MALKKGTTNPAPKAEAEKKEDAQATEEAKKDALAKEAEQKAETEQEKAAIEGAAGPTDEQTKATAEAQKSEEQKAEEAAKAKADDEAKAKAEADAEAEAEAERQKAIEAAKTMGEEFDGSKLIEVHNPQRFAYVQPSTGTRIAGNSTGKLANDSWLQAQLQGRILQKVKS